MGVFIALVQCSLGNSKAGNYMEFVEDLVKGFGELGYRMFLKVHILYANLDNFKENMGAYSEEQI